MPAHAALSPTQQEKAARLYRSGMSAQQIADYFGVSIHAAYYTLRRLHVPRRSARETNAIRFEAKQLSYRLKTKLTRGEEQLKTAAIMLYWAEGYKAGATSTVDFANSDPDMICVFWKFLSSICQVDPKRVRLHLYAYEGQDISALKRYWGRLLKLPVHHFGKPYVKKGSVGPRGPRMARGLIHIRYSDKKLFRQMLAWIDEYRAEMVG